MANPAQDMDFFSDEVTPLQPEALLRFVLLKTPDAQTYRPFGMSLWIDKATVLGNQYRPGKSHTFEFLDYAEESGTYVSALPPRLQRVALPGQPGQSVLALTVFLAPPALFEQLQTSAGPAPLEGPGELDPFIFPE